jgi:carbamoyl-phosphate synthase large subunit
MLELTEDRKQFSELTKTTSLKHTNNKEISNLKNLKNDITEIGLPVIIRPSFVIGGESMYIFTKHEDLKDLSPSLKEQLQLGTSIFQIETYLENAIEYDVDMVRDSFGNFCFTICEHIEFAGVHSGDSGMVTPPTILSDKLLEEIQSISFSIANKLEIVGPINFQFAIKDQNIYCIEANPRGSRTLPFLSKAYNLSLPQIATDAMLGEKIINKLVTKSKYTSVKQSTFPFDRFVQDNILLGPKMRSTGETMGIDRNFHHAMIKSYMGNYPKILETGKILLSISDSTKTIILPHLLKLHEIGFTFMATKGTCDFIKNQGLNCENVAKINENGLTIIDALKDDKMKMVFNTPNNQGQSLNDGEHIRNSAIQYAVPCFTRPENIIAVIKALIGSNGQDLIPLALQDMEK